ncbi:hypothetical protein ACLOJK_014281 [Asimina triloba]
MTEMGHLTFFFYLICKFMSLGQQNAHKLENGDRTKKVGVIDSEFIVHKGIPSLGGSSKNKEEKGSISKVSSPPEIIFKPGGDYIQALRGKCIVPSDRLVVFSAELTTHDAVDLILESVLHLCTVEKIITSTWNRCYTVVEVFTRLVKRGKTFSRSLQFRAEKKGPIEMLANVYGKEDVSTSSATISRAWVSRHILESTPVGVELLLLLTYHHDLSPKKRWVEGMGIQSFELVKSGGWKENLFSREGEVKDDGFDFTGEEMSFFSINVCVGSVRFHQYSGTQAGF